MRGVLPSILLVIFASTCVAADTTGTWKGTIETVVGLTECTVHLKADGDRVSGSVNMDVFGGKIENGRVDGDRVTFTVTLDFGILTYKGRISGDELSFIVSAQDGSYAPMKCKRQK